MESLSNQGQEDLWDRTIYIGEIRKRDGSIDKLESQPRQPKEDNNEEQPVIEREEQ